MSTYQNKIKLNNVSKSLGNIEILKNISLTVNKGELVSILGPSGSGKSTIFNILANLLKVDNGEVILNGHLSYMYQKDMMVPWKSIIDNISMPLIFKGYSKLEARDEVKKYLDTFGLSGFEDKYPNQISGGMKQRANFLKTYLTSNDIMLLDEPFGALDSITRTNLQKWLLDLKSSMDSSILFITHDIDEAVFLSDRIYVISEKPAVIKGEIKVNISKEKDKDVLLTDEFLQIKRNVFKLMEL